MAGTRLFGPRTLGGPRMAPNSPGPRLPYMVSPPARRTAPANQGDSKDMTHPKPVRIAGFLCALSLGALSPMAVSAAEKTTAEDVKAEVKEAGRAVADYTAAQRDEAMRSAKAALEDLDRKIQEMDARLQKNWDKMSEAARKQASATMQDLRRKRNDLAEWYGGMKHSSAEAWEDVKKGFARSYETMKQSFEEAKKEY